MTDITYVYQESRSQNSVWKQKIIKCNRKSWAIVSSQCKIAVKRMNRQPAGGSGKQCSSCVTTSQLDTPWKESCLSRRLEIEGPVPERRIIVLGTDWPTKREVMRKWPSLRFKLLLPSLNLVKGHRLVTSASVDLYRLRSGFSWVH
jgi:hypothetical protein